MTAVWV